MGEVSHDITMFSGSLLKDSGIQGSPNLCRQYEWGVIKRLHSGHPLSNVCARNGNCVLKIEYLQLDSSVH